MHIYGIAGAVSSSPNDAGKAAPEKRQLEVEYVWIDIFCLDQNGPDKMNTIKNTDKIYGWAQANEVVPVRGSPRFTRGAHCSGDWCIIIFSFTCNK